MLGDAPCSPSISPESRSTRTWVLWDPSRTLERDGSITERWQAHDVANALASPSGTKSPLLTLSPEVSPVRTCPSPDAEPASPGNAPASSTSTPASPSLFDPDGYSSR